MTVRNGFVVVGALVVATAGGGGYYWFNREPVLTVTTEAIRERDLDAIVSASGKIQPKRLVNVSADTPGRVVDLAVNEGDRVKRAVCASDPQSLGRASTGAPRSARQRPLSAHASIRQTTRFISSCQKTSLRSNSSGAAAHDTRGAR